MGMNYQTLKVEALDGGILTVSLSRPDKYNAMTRQMVNELIDLWTGLQHNQDIRVVILRGEGEKGFCGGMDVADVWQPAIMNGPHLYDFQFDLGKIEMAMRQIPQPIVCAVHGAAAGAGLCFALASISASLLPTPVSARHLSMWVSGGRTWAPAIF